MAALANLIFSLFLKRNSSELVTYPLFNPAMLLNMLTARSVLVLSKVANVDLIKQKQNSENICVNVTRTKHVLTFYQCLILV